MAIISASAADATSVASSEIVGTRDRPYPAQKLAWIAQGLETEEIPNLSARNQDRDSACAIRRARRSETP